MARAHGPDGRLVAMLRRRLFDEPAHGSLPALLLVLTVVSGLVDGLSLIRLHHVFVANMTGNIVFVGLGLAGVKGFTVGTSLTALAGFVVGAAATTLYPASWRSDRARLLRTSAVIKLVLMCPVVIASGVVGVAPNPAVVYVFICALAVSMGIQNATVQRLGVPELPTTVLTTTLTRLMADLPGRKWRDAENGYRLASIVCLLLGAATGALLVLNVNAMSTLVVAVVLLAVVGLVARRAEVTSARWALFPRAPSAVTDVLTASTSGSVVDPLPERA